MPSTTCSHCNEEIDARPWNASDIMFDWQCPNCGEAVMIDGNAKEQQRQRDARERITAEIQTLADELETPSYQPAPYSVEELRDRLGSILEEIDEELERR